MKQIVICLALLCLYFKAHAQVLGEVNVLDKDVFYVHYTAPNAIEENFNYQKVSARLNAPPIRLKRLSLFNTIGFDYHQFSYDIQNSDLQSVQKLDEIETFFNINYSLFASYKLSNKWSLNASVTPFLLSNLKESSQTENVRVNGNFFIERTFFRKRGGYLQVAVGLGYFTINGSEQIVPVTNIRSRLNKKWSFVVGFPNTYVKYDFNQKHSLKLLADFNDLAGFTSSDASSIRVRNTQVYSVNFTTLSPALEYNFWFTPAWGAMLRVGGVLLDNYEIRDRHNEKIVALEPGFTQPMVTFGIKFNPLRQLQNGLKPF
ncbi:hypothetical protein BKI52_17030 [marine bacterium AO1-C]|nr:hypothetical protein BKI52_17030 [marine bacterium AO1-C]